VLTFESITGLAGGIACKIYQLGKFPMRADSYPMKSIPREIIEAVGYQVEFLFKQGKKINQRSKKTRAIGENYSDTYEDIANDTIANRIAPLARDILEKAGYTTQTI
jgi:hypothetical protein